MHTLRLLPLCLVFLFSVSSNAQQNLQPGAIVLKDGSRQTGWIDYKDWEHNPKQIAFRAAMDGEAVFYGVRDLQSFEVEGKDRYEVHAVTRTIAPADIVDLDSRQPVRVVQDTVFLRMVVKGDRFSLFEFVDQRRYFYIQQLGTDPVELRFRLEKKSGGSFIRHNQYREQLKALTDDAQLRNRIEHSEYSVNALARIVRQLNGTVTYGGAGTAPRNAVRFLVGGGASFNSLDLVSSSPTLNNMKFKATASPFVSVGAEISASRNFSRLKGRLDLSLSTAGYEGNVTEAGGFSGQQEQKKWVIKQSNIIASFTLKYSFYHKGTTEVFGSGTWSTYFTRYLDNTLTTTNTTTGNVKKQEDYLAIKRQWSTLQLGAGARFNHIEVAVSARMAGSFFGFVDVTGRLNMIGTGVYYIF